MYQNRRYGRCHYIIPAYEIRLTKISLILQALLNSLMDLEIPGKSPCLLTLWAHKILDFIKNWGFAR